MTLFIGNLSHDTIRRDLSSHFDKYGNNKIDMKVRAQI